MPHTPHNPPQKYLDMFSKENIPIPAYISKGKHKSFLSKEHLSLAMEAWMDDEIGQLRNKMKKKGQDENTIYIFLIDNGWSNGLPAKGSVFEKGVQTPVIVTWPGHLPAAQKRTELISSVDIYPTILDYAGADIPTKIPGRSLRSMIEKNAPSHHKKSTELFILLQQQIMVSFQKRTSTPSMSVPPSGNMYFTQKTFRGKSVANLLNYTIFLPKHRCVIGEMKTSMIS